MKIGLIGLNSQFVHSALALYYLRETAPPFCHCTIREYNINEPILDIFYDITSEDWDILAFSCYIWNKETLLKLLPLLRQTLAKTVFILGGPEATYTPKDFPQADYIVYGALEDSWPRLLETLDKGLVPDLPGLKGEIQFAFDWPFPYREEDIPALKHRFVYYETSRGCPYKCGFCLSSAEKNTAFLPLERVKRELDFFIAADIPVVKLVDRTFNHPKERAKEILGYLIGKESHNTTFHLELKGELIDDETLAMLLSAPPGLFQVEIGIQTLNEEALKASRRSNRWEEVKAIYEKLGKADNVHTHFDLIAALPYEDYKSFQYSFSEAMTIMPNHMQLGFLKLLPGTSLAEAKKKHGYIAQEYPPYEVVANNYISPGEMGELKKIDKFLDSYYNKGQLKNLFRFAMDAWEKPLFSLFHSLSGSSLEPALALSELMPEKRDIWCGLARFDSFLAGRKVRVTPEEEKELKDFLSRREMVDKLLPHYIGFPMREIYKRVRLGIFPFSFKLDGQKLIDVYKGESMVLFDYKVKTNKKLDMVPVSVYVLKTSKKQGVN